MPFNARSRPSDLPHRSSRSPPPSTSTTTSRLGNSITSLQQSLQQTSSSRLILNNSFNSLLQLPQSPSPNCPQSSSLRTRPPLRHRRPTLPRPPLWARTGLRSTATASALASSPSSVHQDPVLDRLGARGVTTTARARSVPSSRRSPPSRSQRQARPTWARQARTKRRRMRMTRWSAEACWGWGR